MVSQHRTTGPLKDLYESFKAGSIDRREFLRRAAILGVSTGGALFLANTANAAASGGSTRNGAAFIAQDATPGASPTTGGGARPSVGTEGQTRGAGGDLNLLQWQAPTLLSPHVATGVKDVLGSILVLEPLIHYLPDSTMIPNLVTEVPSVENGQLAEDLSSVTFTLLPDVKWSDGEPLTAEDVKFTVEWVQNPDNNSTNQGVFESIKSVEVVDDLTAKVTFNGPNPFWFDPFTGTSTGFVYPKHVLEAAGSHDAFLSKPVGTGPYVVESFTPNDNAVYVTNENYREANKPFFAKVNLKGGGDAAAAARAVLQTGEYDFAWNLQVEPDVLASMAKDDAPGVAIPYPGVTVERINFNFSDPNKEVDGQRSQKDTPHPYLTDDAVREAIYTAIDRQQIADSFYGGGQKPATNILNGDPATDSPNTSWEFNQDKAKQLLDDAGWALDGDVRAKDGVELNVVYATSVNAVRQKTQAVVKANLEQIGFKVQLEQIDAGIYFDGAAGTEQNINHFYWDFDMYQSVPNSPRPNSYMEAWYTGKDGVNIAQKSNAWNGQNTSRWSNADYDAAYEASQTEIDAEKLAGLFVQMNDLVVTNHVVVPLVIVGSPRGVSKRLRQDNIALAPFSYDYWNIANWNLAEGAS